jgi:hypothetical protein
MRKYIKRLATRVAKKLGEPIGVYDNGRVRLIYDSEEHRKNIAEYAGYFNYAVEQGFIEINGGCEVRSNTAEEAGACRDCLIVLTDALIGPSGAVMKNLDIYCDWKKKGKF